MHFTEFEHACTELAHQVRVLLWTIEDGELDTNAPQRVQLLARDGLIEAAKKLEEAKDLIDAEEIKGAKR